MAITTSRPNLNRQMGILPPRFLRNKEIYLVGAGGIGSWSALALAMMGFSDITVFDDDILEDHNRSSQIYMPQDVRLPKVAAMQHVMDLFAPHTHLHVHREKVSQETNLKGIVVSAVDSMQSRSQIWNAVKRNVNNVEFYIDARMAIEFLMLYSFVPSKPEQQTWYEKFLYPDSEVIQAPCTERAIVYTALIAAGEVSKNVKKYLTGQPVRRLKKVDIANDISVVSQDNPALAIGSNL